MNDLAFCSSFPMKIYLALPQPRCSLGGGAWPCLNMVTLHVLPFLRSRREVGWGEGVREREEGKEGELGLVCKKILYIYGPLFYFVRDKYTYFSLIVITVELMKQWGSCTDLGWLLHTSYVSANWETSWVRDYWSLRGDFVRAQIHVSSSLKYSMYN